MESLSDKDYILELQDKLWKLRGKIEALESTIKFLKEEQEISKVAIAGCNQVFEINEKLKKEIEGFEEALNSCGNV